MEVTVEENEGRERLVRTVRLGHLPRGPVGTIYCDGNSQTAGQLPACTEVPQGPCLSYGGDENLVTFMMTFPLPSSITAKGLCVFQYIIHISHRPLQGT